ncbi:hypothetical protein SLS53_003022 [Cytospora paraplurivora]|uniref:NADP-dependent oxidoreductase domain-containing protein n=1 Tax=Cytospora paraplurivora TaxID=2898453 RepID=A0AAN9UD32_9PEZI
MAPQLVFGAGVIGMDGMEFQGSESVTKLLLKLKKLGIDRLDTAARYPPFNPGRSEQLLGAANALSDTFIIDTKVNSVDSSLERLHRPQGVNVLFAHRPDPATPLEEQVQGFQDQGSYSLITRGAETRVLPILRAHGISFLASHALASEFLTDKHVDADGNPVGRSAQNSSFAAPEVAAAMKRFVAGCGAQGLPPVEVASRWVAHHSALGEEDGIVLGGE